MNPALSDLIRLLAETAVEAYVADLEGEQGKDHDDGQEEEAA